MRAMAGGWTETRSQVSYGPGEIPRRPPSNGRTLLRGWTFFFVGGIFFCCSPNPLGAIGDVDPWIFPRSRRELYEREFRQETKNEKNKQTRPNDESSGRMCNLNLYIGYILYIVKDLCDINGYLQLTRSVVARIASRTFRRGDSGPALDSGRVFNGTDIFFAFRLFCQTREREISLVFNELIALH